MSNNREKKYIVQDQDSSINSEDTVTKKKPGHYRNQTNSKLNQSEAEGESDSESGSGEDASVENSEDIKEYDSSNAQIESITKKHTMKPKNGTHKIINGEGDPPPREGRKVNSLLGALSRRKAQAIRAMNAASNAIPDREEVEFSESTGLSHEQQELYSNSMLLFRYNDKWRVYWDMFIMLLAIWNCFIIPVEVAFEPPEFDNPWFLVTNGLIDVMFALDIFVVFRTTYVDIYSGEEVLDGYKIVMKYLSGRFWIDLLATIPFDTFGELIISGNTSYLQIFGILKLIRITRLSKIIAYLNVKEDFKIMLKLIKLIFFLIMYIHLVGCAWFWIVNEQDKDWIPPLDYVFVTSNYFNEDTEYKYWMAVYHSILILTGNDIGPRNKTLQVVFCAVFVTFGAIVNAYIFGELVVLVAVINTKTSQFVEKLDTCNTAMKNLKMSMDLQSEVVGYLTYTQAMLDSQRELETFIGLISPSLKEKVIKEIFSDVLSKNKIFRGHDQLIDSLTRKLQTKIYQPEEHIINQGEDADKIYFISNGGAIVYVRNRHGMKKKVNALKNGELFGEVAILNNSKRTATVKANNYSTIAHIEKDVFFRLFSKYIPVLTALKAKRKEYQDEYKLFIKDILRFIDYIKSVSEETVEELTYFIKEISFEADTMIFRAGAVVDKIYFIAEGEVDIIAKVGKREAVLDTLYQGCNIGEYGVLGDYTHSFSAKAKTNVSLMYIEKEAVLNLRDKFSDLRKETNICIDYLENSGLPLVDFRIYRNTHKHNKQNTVEVLKLAVARVMRINEALEANYTPEEITEILKAVQIKVQFDHEGDANQKNTNKMLQNIMTKLQQIQMQAEEQRESITLRIHKMEKSISQIKSEVTGRPMTVESSKTIGGDEDENDEDLY